VLLALAEKGPNMDAARVAQRRHEERHQARCAVDLDAPLAEVDLKLLTGPRLEPDRRARLGAQLLAQVRHRPLHRAQAHHYALLRHEFLADHVGIAAMAPEALLDPRLKAVQRLRAQAWRRLAPCALPQPTPSRRPRTPELRRNPTCAPAKRLQSQHGRHIVRLQHLVPPQTLGPRKRLLRRHGHPDLLSNHRGG